MLGERRKKKHSALLAINPSGNATRELVLDAPEYTLGSGPTVQLIVRDNSVSRRHASLRLKRGRWQVIDQGSANGTFVDDRKASEWVTLRNGQEVRFGGARFVFESDARTGSNPVRTSYRSRRKALSGLRALIVLILVSLVVGFGTAEYLIYRSYKTATGRSSAPAAANSKISGNS